ncbi:hypothetical protein C5167_003977 [Papaver somniferum]|nr:hypothetical protein C5167_003977 [Papaver somniferum]
MLSPTTVVAPEEDAGNSSNATAKVADNVKMTPSVVFEEITQALSDVDPKEQYLPPFEKQLSDFTGYHKTMERNLRSQGHKVMSKKYVLDGYKQLYDAACDGDWEKAMPQIKQLYNQKLMHKQALALVKSMIGQLKEAMNRKEIAEFFNSSTAIKVAIKHGSTEFIEATLEKLYYLIWQEIGGLTMIQMAVQERDDTIFNYLCETADIMGEKLSLYSKEDKSYNTLLHYAAKLAPLAKLNLVSGAALQMQRELQWFKGVESILLKKKKFSPNIDGDTAQSIFTEEHKDLVVKGEKWMKDTSGSCMVVATLIATVAFAAAFTIPGGNISDSNSGKNGTPVFLGTTSFIVFVVADALALFSSITSVLMFLALYTSRYAEEEFLMSLPRKLVIGLGTLFISMATILVAFSAALSIALEDRCVWAPIPMALFSCVPVLLFVLLQLPLFVEIVRSAYWGSLFSKHRYALPRMAIKHGYTEFIVATLEKFNYLIFQEMGGRTMPQMAVQERNDTILNYLCETADIMGGKIRLYSKEDKSYNTLLHYAAKLALLA